MQSRHMNNVIDAVLGRFGIYRPGGEDNSGHEALHVLLCLDPTIGLLEF
jgi:hypothetical protein